MARYNTALATSTITGAATISSPYQGAFTALTGSAPYTVTLPSPALYPGSNQTFYNATGGNVTLSTPSGSFSGTGGSGSSTLLMYTGNVASITSDGTNYVVISEDGSALVATTGQFSGDVTMNGGFATVSITPSTLNVAPTSTSNINNVAIGSTTRASGAFTTLAANNQVQFTGNIASSGTSSGTLVVTGGIGASGTIYAGGFNGPLTGTLQTSAQPNITSHGTLTSLAVSGSSSLTTTSITKSLTASDWDALTIANSGSWSTALGKYASLVFTDGTNRIGSIGATYDGVGRLDFNSFYNGGSGSNSAVVMSVRGNNRVAVGGTTTPSATLDVYQEGSINVTTPGQTTYGLHLTPSSRTSNNAVGITFGADTSSGTTAQAGIYSQFSGSYGTRMYIATTDSYATGAKTRITINESGTVTIGSSTYPGYLQVNGGTRFFPYPNDGVRWIDTDNSLRTNWQGTTSQRTSWGLYWKYNDSNVRAAITYDHASSEEFQFASGYGPIVFNQRPRNGNLDSPNDGNELLRLDSDSYGGMTVSTRASVSGQLNIAGSSKLCFFTYGTYGGNGYVHFKTNLRNTTSQMYVIEAKGYSYGASQSIGGHWCGYMYQPNGTSNPISASVNNYGNANFCYSQYLSTDGYLVLVANTAPYYTAATFNSHYTAQGIYDMQITAWTQSTATSGVY